MSSSYGICTTGTKKKTQKIDLYFEDKIKNTKNIKITLFSWTRIDELKKKLMREKYDNHLSFNDLRLFYKNIQLTPDNRRFFDFGVQPESVIHIKSIDPDKQIERGIINPYQLFDVIPDEIKNLILEVQSGLNNGKKPKLAEQGTSGTYFLENYKKKNVAIFKPFNEQPYAQNNPRNYIGKTGQQGIRKGILSGQSATREVATYLLDQNHFHSVPSTTYVQFFHPTFLNKDDVSNPITSDKQKMFNKENQLKTKHGSLQEFVQSHDIVGNMGSNQFDVQQVHKIGILDLRILNCDRNEANILVRKMTVVGKEKGKGRVVFKLIPIDHGLSFPDNFEIYDQEMVWMGYRQASKPFSQKSLKFIESIDPVEDCKRLRQKLGFREICLRNFRIAQIFLKKMAKAGFNLYQIGQMMYRKDEYFSDEQQEQKMENIKQKSDLQRLVGETQNLYFVIKENGIKSTVNCQLKWLNNHRKQEQSLPELEDEPKKEKKVTFQKVQKTSLQKNSKNDTVVEQKLKTSPTKIRNVSLPNLKIEKKESKIEKEKKKKKRSKNAQQNMTTKRRQKEWDQVFFHYFEGNLDRFIEEKRKKSRGPPSRSRLLSQDINYEY